MIFVSICQSKAACQHFYCAEPASFLPLNFLLRKTSKNLSRSDHDFSICLFSYISLSARTKTSDTDLSVSGSYSAIPAARITPLPFSVPAQKTCRAFNMSAHMLFLFHSVIVNKNIYPYHDERYGYDEGNIVAVLRRKVFSGQPVKSGRICFIRIHFQIIYS